TAVWQVAHWSGGATRRARIGRRDIRRDGPEVNKLTAFDAASRSREERKRPAPAGPRDEWCGRGDSNPHGIATASPSSWCVCQFRHFRFRERPELFKPDWLVRLLGRLRVTLPFCSSG